MRLLRRLLPKPLRPARGVLRLVQPARESRERPFSALERWIDGGGLEAPPPAVGAALAHAERLRGELAGTMRDTWMSLAMRHVDAGAALAALSSPAPACTLLHRLVHLLRPAWVLELGSAFGIASLAVAHALAEVGNGRFDGIELEPWKATLADGAVREVLGARGHVHAGSIEDVLPALLREPHEPLALAFVDAVHTFDATWGYHRLLADAAAPGAVVVYDDVPFSDDMRRCWRAIAAAAEVTDAVLVAGRWGVARYRGAAVTPARSPTDRSGSATS